MFTMRDKQEHRARAKRISPVFGGSTLVEVESTVSAQIEKLVHILEQRVYQPVDVMLWFRILTLDTFGQSSTSYIVGYWCLTLIHHRGDILGQDFRRPRPRTRPCDPRGP